MGDDLNFAQKFTRTAADGLALLTEMPDPRAETEAPVIINMMTTVQRGAKRLRARHIYTGAQDVLSALHHETDEVLTGRIKTLGFLVTEYARGLDELLTASQPRDLTSGTDEDKWDMARETLNDLLPKATPDTADMLSRLMRAPVTLASVQPDAAYEDDMFSTEAEIVPFRTSAGQDKIVITNTVDLNNTETVVEAAPLVAESPLPAGVTTAGPKAAPSVALDAMMRDVIADALSVARSINRTISVSYDMGDRNVSEPIAQDLRSRLGTALSQIIRQALSDDRVGHIDINLAGEQLHIMAGTTAMRVAIDPKTAPAKKPLITTETEQGLREQLDALMDPISFHETAS